ncbi:hypothetical protein PFAG_05722 [Plasmodium falciparum Santa Lucia]|uniref:CH-like domain-containing protein n=8 Tax=Plasmodium falciparum TaxID=5833 RepID=Q8IKK9_PLAF7|nr:conserved Plasmodium protein, unknown function [Plasmodium falciparum 3D7]ETW15816.1 hypothetical protein PFFVO_05267 [Plasmodium falciparum Vietnam Oak-Knoll (FVO)]ETW46559.1 hypothetical protein PFMALIP_05462 [Plasmodium falciparum MaliPS096_E11]ETW54289.1 hypothetical protein PFUGPA_04158 [Plasmodium falciparum Palo Alto/Uganda]ETW58607.1 hypothetical protein PFMC_05704 [Plasmodium falciparum CAMP/Malaysia]EUT79151.1 hypothetical protein PFAG_05722 [Plasmodium falciparum Santa Lucia]KAF|eukprot:XP_001348769.2 conserved Plasmodium protein, unknown function [Plasmodium falciparum 3D7]
MELPREVIKWLHHLNISYSLRNIKSASNGIIIAEILNIYIPQSIHMNSLENGFSKEIKRKNWIIIKKVLTHLNIHYDETAIINSEKNEIVKLFIQLYEYFNEDKAKYECIQTNEEENKKYIPSFARSTITQKIRESNIHDIVDEDKKHTSAYQLIKQEEYNAALQKEKEKEEKEYKNKQRNKKNDHNETYLYNDIEKSCSIITINDNSDYPDYTDIKTLDSFIKDKNNLKTLTMKSVKLFNERENKQVPQKYTQDEKITDIIYNTLNDYIAHYECETFHKSDFIISIYKMNKFYKNFKYEEYNNSKVINNLYEKFYIICSLKEYELIRSILDNLQLFNENISIIISLNVLCNPSCDKEIFNVIMKYIKQLLSYLRINDMTTNDILCNIIIRSLFLLHYDENKDISCFCELIIMIINNDINYFMNILSMIKNMMSFHFFYLFLTTLLNNSPNSFIYNKDVKDIYLYYIFIGLHTNKKNIMLLTLNILNMLSQQNNYYEIVYLSGLFLKLLELRNIHYDIFLFVICSNMISMITEHKKQNEFSIEVKQLYQVCSLLLKSTKNKDLLYLFFLYSHQLVDKDEHYCNLFMEIYGQLSEEEHKAFFSSNVLDQCFRNLYKYKIMKKYFHNILNENINILNERFNTAVLNLLMTTDKWKEASYLKILKNFIIYKKDIKLFNYIAIYNNIFENMIQNIFSENNVFFEISKDVLNFYWFSSNEELKKQSFEISKSYLKDIYVLNRNRIYPHTIRYIEILEKGYNKNNILI